MAVEAFVGLVGGGKSFNSVRRMMSYMARGGRCCSNILLADYDIANFDFLPTSPVLSYLRSIGWEYQKGQYTYISFDQMVTNPLWINHVPAGIDREHRTLLVVNEATDLFDTLDGGRLRVDSAYREIFHFLRLSRHVHVDVLFIAQDISSINTRLRGLVSYIWRSTDMKNFRLAKFKIPFPFDLFMLQQFDRNGKYEVRREWVKKDKRIFTLYRSEAFHDSLSVKWDGVSVNMEQGQIKDKKKMTRFQMVILLGSVLLGIFNFVRGSSDGARSRSVVCVTNFVSSAVSTSGIFSISSGAPTNVYLRGSYSFHSSTGCPPWVVFRGLPVRQGVPCEFGTVLRITPTHTLLDSESGSKVFLLPQEPEEVRSFSPVVMKVYRYGTSGPSAGASF